jgi:hypothetical protein
MIAEIVGITNPTRDVSMLFILIAVARSEASLIDVTKKMFMNIPVRVCAMALIIIAGIA